MEPHEFRPPVKARVAQLAEQAERQMFELGLCELASQSENPALWLRGFRSFLKIAVEARGCDLDYFESLAAARFAADASDLFVAQLSNEAINTARRLRDEGQT